MTQRLNDPKNRMIHMR